MRAGIILYRSGCSIMHELSDRPVSEQHRLNLMPVLLSWQVCSINGNDNLHGVRGWQLAGSNWSFVLQQLCGGLLPRQ